MLSVSVPKGDPKGRLNPRHSWWEIAQQALLLTEYCHQTHLHMGQTGNQGSAKGVGLLRKQHGVGGRAEKQADLLTHPTPCPSHQVLGLWQLRGPGRAARDMCSDVRTLWGVAAIMYRAPAPQPTPTWTLQNTWGLAIIPKPE